MSREVLKLVGKIKPTTNISVMWNYYRQKEHIKYQFLLRWLIYGLCLAHFILALLFIGIKEAIEHS